MTIGHEVHVLRSQVTTYLVEIDDRAAPSYEEAMLGDNIKNIRKGKGYSQEQECGVWTKSQLVNS